MVTALTVDDYMAALPEDRRGPMEALRRTILEAAPDADEVISYRMPAFRSNGRFLVSYDAFRKHYSLFPASQGVVTGLGDEVAPYLHGRGTIRFPATEALPLELIARIVRIRLTETAAESAR